MDHISILSLDDSLDKNCHVNLIQGNTYFLGRQERSLIELGSPNLLDSGPSLGKIRYSKSSQLLFDFSHDWVGYATLVAETEHDLLALEEAARHLVNLLRR